MSSVPGQELSPAARRHRDELLAEVDALHAACLEVKGYYGPLNHYLMAYDDVMQRCPAHARADVAQAFLSLAERLGLAGQARRRIDLRVPDDRRTGADA